MIQYIAIGVVAIIVSQIINSEDETVKQYQKKLTNQRSDYEDKLDKREKYNENKKRSLLFCEIKREQKELKYERKKLFSLRDNCEKGSLMYKQINKNVRQVSQQIEQKQRDADFIRF